VIPPSAVTVLGGPSVGRHTPFTARESEGRLIFRLLVSAAIGLCVAFASQAHAADDSVGSSGPTKTFVYKKTKQAELEIVVHFPPGWKTSDRRAAIVFFFGGGWTNGRLSQFEPQATALASRSLVTARADYRVKSRHGVSPDACVEDAKSAVRWLRQNALMLGIDSNRLVAAGGSAGGHIAACTALTDGLEAAGEDLRISSRPNAMILFNPVLRLDHLPALLARVGHDEKLAKQISPNLHISKETPPTLMFFGDQDPLMRQGEEFVRQAKQVGCRAELVTAQGQKHGYFNHDPWTEQTLQRADDFLVSLGYLPKR
jgi:acetyl esterase